MIEASSALNEILASFSIKPAFQGSAMVYLVAPGSDLMVQEEDNWLRLDLTQFDTYILSFARSSRTLLPEPYETKCKNYSEVTSGKSSSRVGCLRGCLVSEHSKTEFPKWPPLVPAPPDVKLQAYGSVSGGDKPIVNHVKLCQGLCGVSEDCH